MRDEDIVIHQRQRQRDQRGPARPSTRDEDIVFRRRYPRPTPEPLSGPADRSV